MKLSHLSLAILSAIALSACGGGSSDHTKDPKPTPDPVPTEPTPDENNNDKDNPNIEKDGQIDPTQTGVVGKLNFKTESSVGTTQYIRDEGSAYDRDSNPHDPTVATSILGVTLNDQNPNLTNIGLGKLVNDKGITKVAQFVGNDREDAPLIGKYTSLQQQNKHNVQALGKDDLTGSATHSVLEDANKDELTAQIEAVDNAIKLYKQDRNLDSQGRANLRKMQALQAKLKGVQAALKSNSDIYKNGYILDKDSNTIQWGDNFPTLAEVVALDKSSVEKKPKFDATYDSSTKKWNFGAQHTGPVALGLIGLNFKKQGLDKSQEIQGTEEASESSTRIFGRNFNEKGLKAPYNSYYTAEKFLTVNGLTGFVGANITDVASADAEIDTQIAAHKDDLQFGLAVKPLQLEYVQYGRVTADLDPDAGETTDITEEQLADGKTYYKRVPYLTKGSEKAVDTYFYRGPHATTVEQMAALPSGKELVYQGHALMYGIDNSFHGNKTTALPNSFGVREGYGVGNFVQAVYKVDKQRVENGIVYNVWTKDHQPTVDRDVLVTFDGNVFGNTVLGEAQRTYNTSDKADFRASFFGAKADEMGGSFNSTTWQERYGAKGDVWGGVFGAQRFDIDEQPATKWSNQQLGDIPNITAPVNQAGVPGKTTETQGKK